MVCVAIHLASSSGRTRQEAGLHWATYCCREAIVSTVGAPAPCQASGTDTETSIHISDLCASSPLAHCAIECQDFHCHHAAAFAECPEGPVFLPLLAATVAVVAVAVAEGAEVAVVADGQAAFDAPVRLPLASSAS